MWEEPVFGVRKRSILPDAERGGGSGSGVYGGTLSLSDTFYQVLFLGQDSEFIMRPSLSFSYAHALVQKVL